MYNIGDVVWTDKKLHSTQENIVGKITNIFPSFITILTEKNTKYSVHVTDLDYVHLIKKNQFESYDREARNKDIENALK